MKALSTIEIDQILKKNSVTRDRFLGTFPSCIYPQTDRKENSFISNTDYHDAPGRHWIAWYVNQSTVTFFDSFGRAPFNDYFPVQYTDFIDKFDRVIYMNGALQKSDSVACGYYCIHFIYVFSLGLTFDSFLEDYYDLKNNDIVATDFVYSIRY